MGKYILALDQGTTSSRAILFDSEQNILAIRQHELTQHYPHEGWVEQDPMEIWSTQYAAMLEVLAAADVSPSDVAGIGITNQRETTILWDKNTGRPIHNAIVWQCRRTADIVDRLVQDGLSGHIRRTTGLVPDAYFSGTKIKWLLDHVEGAREKAERGEILFGTVDSWLVWKLTSGKVHITDATNAARTMIFDIHRLDWDDTLLEALDIPRAMLPRVCSSSEVYGSVSLPTACESKNGLLTTIGIQISGETQYALEGSVFVGGAVIQWLRDEMRFFSESRDAEYYAGKVKDTGGVYLVPAFTGLGAPHWDMYARGCLIGLTRGTTREHIIRAAQESIAYQVNDLLTAMKRDTGTALSSLSVDGGASRDSFLMQFQSDISDCTIRRPVIRETTALGACYLAGLATGVWHSREELKQLWRCDTLYAPSMNENKRRKLLSGWDKAVGRSLDWAEH